MAARISYNGSNGFSSRYQTIIQTVTVVALVIAGLWAAVIAPMQTYISKLDAKIDAQELVNRNLFLSLGEFKGFKDKTEQGFDHVDKEILRNRDAIVPITTLQQKWTADNFAINEVQRRIDEIRK